MSTYLVTLRPHDVFKGPLGNADICHIVLDPTEHIRVAIGDVNSPWPIVVDGLVSDSRALNIAGELALFVSITDSALDVCLNLNPSSDEVVTVANTPVSIEVTRPLTGEIIQQVAFHGDIAVARILEGAEDIIGMQVSPSVLSSSEYAVIADWTETILSAMEDMTIDALVYKEVG